jgi:flagellar biosynthesis/type III secretory pathway protein FliH
MDGVMQQRAAYTRIPGRNGLSALFGEDFDAEHRTLDPEAVEPSYSAAEVTKISEAAWRDGHLAGLQEAATDHAAALCMALQDVATQLVAECRKAISHAERSGEAVARLLLGSLGAAFPTLCARYGDAEVRSIVGTILPTLTREAAIGLRMHSSTAATLIPVIADLQPDLAASLQIVECDAMSPGDVRIAWRNGTVERDATALWQQIAEVLALADLLDADPAIRETVDGD